jgi:2,4-dienoyl-CoA reductase (NADPH2)
LITRSALNQLARSAEPIYRRQLRSRLAANPLIEVVASATIVALRDDGVALQLASGERRDLAAGSLVVAQGRDPADELLAELREAGVPCELIGDAHSVGRIGDAVHAGHAAVRKLITVSSAGHSPGTIHDHPFRT